MQLTPDPEKCAFGVTGYNYDDLYFIIPNATISYTSRPELSADTAILGSFCPLITGSYLLDFDGVKSLKYDHYSVFRNKTYGLPYRLENQYLKKGVCYSFKILSTDTGYTYSTLSVQLNDNPPYIPNSTELLTCQFDGCLNGATSEDCSFNKKTSKTKRQLSVSTVFIMLSTYKI